jgi:hypothetical protein
MARSDENCGQQKEWIKCLLRPGMGLELWKQKSNEVIRKGLCNKNTLNIVSECTDMKDRNKLNGRSVTASTRVFNIAQREKYYKNYENTS